MKIKLLLFFALVFGIGANAQSLQSEADVNCGTPPPPGYDYVYGLDTDNDGFALFDMQYYVDHIDRPQMESYFGVSSSGYDATFYVAMVSQPFLYTNTSQNQDAWLGYQYNGSGPEFTPQPPCFWLVEWYFGSKGLKLITVPHDGDDDNDGILNEDEDANHNLNLMDDDEDNDGIINLKDNVNNLSSAQHSAITLSVYPNPVTNGVVNFNSNIEMESVTIYDVTGKQVSENKINGTTLNVRTLSAGMYFLKFQSENGSAFKKIVIR